MGVREELMAVGPLDGRYAEKTAALRPITSEFGLIQRRVQVGSRWVGILGQGILPDMEPLSDVAQGALAAIPENFTLDDAVEIKAIEKRTNHDANAVVRWLKDKLRGNDGLQAYAEFVHFGGTSEDTNNLAYALVVRDAHDEVLLPGITGIKDNLDEKASDFAALPLLARTHGQPASPTTVGKEMAVFRDRLDLHLDALASISILGKFNGASGNYSAASFAYPEVNWPAAARHLVSSFDLGFNSTTTQIEPHDWMARFFNELRLGNNIMLDAARDFWSYISFDEFAQQVNPDEDGSSAMPNKVNPIDFENAEANVGIANALLSHLADKLQVSRLQRDLSDSSAQRAIGEAFGHAMVAHTSLKRALGKVSPNTTELAAHLDNNWAVLMEPLQTVMRRYGIDGAYDDIKRKSRGKKVTEALYRDMVGELTIPDEAKTRLLELTPATYIGRAADITVGDC